jgi:hypothetical protein
VEKGKKQTNKPGSFSSSSTCCLFSSVGMLEVFVSSEGSQTRFVEDGFYLFFLLTFRE